MTETRTIIPGYIDYRQKFHLCPRTGYMNAPGGLCFFNGEYHMFYEHCPRGAAGGKALWGHFTTADFIRYRTHPPAILPDSVFDSDGIYAGSALTVTDGIHLFYTGNVEQKGDFDYVTAGREQNTMRIFSPDGYNMEKKEVLLKNSDYPPDVTLLVRNPKVWQSGKKYYMIMGAGTLTGEGCALIYVSDNLSEWRFYRRISSPERLGRSWENPDAFLLDGAAILLLCVCSISEDELRCPDMSGYCDLYEDRAVNFRPLDYGFDFYAPQTFDNGEGRRILVAWMGMEKAPYTNPTVENGWQHCMTIPRELRYKNGVLRQYPLSELAMLRESRRFCVLYRGDKGDTFGSVFEAELNLTTDSYTVFLRDDISLRCDNGIITVSLGKSGSGRTKKSFKAEKTSNVKVFSDVSSIEIFIDGISFSSRVYDSGKGGIYIADGECRAEIYKLKAFEFTAE